MSRLILKIFFVTSLFISINSSATTLQQITFEDMVAEANACVVAKAIDSTFETRDGQVVTVTTFKVLKTAFGTTSETITLVTAGGEKPLGRLKTSEVIAGAPKFFAQQENLMLITSNSQNNEYQIVGFNQGLFPVVTDPNGLASVVLPPSVGGNTSIDNALEVISTERAEASSAPLAE